MKSTEWGWRLGGKRAGGVREEEEELERWGCREIGKITQQCLILTIKKG